MWTVQNDQYINPQGMFHSLPLDYRLPWIPSPVIAFQENRNTENLRSNSQFSFGFNDFLPVFGNNLDKMQSLETDQFMTLQNSVNENRLQNSKKFNQNDPSNFNSRKQNRKKRNRRRRTLRTLHQVTNDAITNSPYELRQQGHQGWSHVPKLNWLQSNSHTRPIKTNFQNPFRSGSFDKRGVNSYRPQNSTRSEFTSTSHNSSGSATASEAPIPRTDFKSRNASNNYFGRKLINATSRNSPTVNNNNMSGITESKTKSEINSSTNSRNFANFNESKKEDDDDIIYLFTVDSSSEEKIVLEIDLQSEAMNLVPNKSSTKTVNLIEESTADVITVKKPEPTMLPKSRKRKLANNENKTNKRTSNQPRCTACAKGYHDVVGENGNLYISTSCSHVFCHSCISKDRNSNVCPACGIKFLSFRRLFL